MTALQRIRIWSNDSSQDKFTLMDLYLAIVLLLISGAVYWNLYAFPRTSKAPLTVAEIATMNISHCAADAAVAQIVSKRALSSEWMALTENQCLSDKPRDPLLQDQLDALKKYHVH